MGEPISPAPNGTWRKHWLFYRTYPDPFGTALTLGYSGSSIATVETTPGLPRVSR